MAGSGGDFGVVRVLCRIVERGVGSVATDNQRAHAQRPVKDQGRRDGLLLNARGFGGNLGTSVRGKTGRMLATAFLN